LLLYRVFPYLATARAGQPGHPLYLRPGQGAGRWDNARRYLAWYLAQDPTSAVGEVLADLPVWREETFNVPQLPGVRRALGVYQVPDGLPYVDLDDASTLVRLGMRPTQVVQRNRPYTQAKALEIYEEGRWRGLRWWSFHHPSWHAWCLWDVELVCEHVEDLALSHPAVRDAAKALAKQIA
jgi:hypothetical protein